MTLQHEITFSLFESWTRTQQLADTFTCAGIIHKSLIVITHEVNKNFNGKCISIKVTQIFLQGKNQFDHNQGVICFSRIASKDYYYPRRRRFLKGDRGET